MNDKIKKDMPAVINGRRKIRNDIIFIVALLLVVSLIGVCLFFTRKQGDVVEVTVDGKPYGIYSLSQDIRVEIKTGENGEQRNVLVIEDGRAYVEKASCPDGICSSHRPINHEGESIICLPHKVVIAVYSSGDAPDVVV